MTALTTKSIMLTKIVHGTRDCVGIIAGVQHIDGPMQVKYGGPDPCDPCGVDAYAGDRPQLYVISAIFKKAMR